MSKKLITISGIFYLISLIIGLISLQNINIKLGREYNNFPLGLSFNHILWENMYTTIQTTLGGTITLGALSFMSLVPNGLHMGLLIASFNGSFPPWKIALLILPHGIFEIPAIIIAGAAGFKIPYKIVRYLAGRKEQILTKEDIKEYLTLTLISIILIVIAAFVEAYITPRIAEFFWK